MKCHYEVLDVPREADDAEIKTAYRKLALKWHPDKNLDNPDNAKEQFQLVQQAYEVLSDRQERAWYDSHREQILHGANSEFEDNSLDLFQYFTTSCFKGYDDDENGFYSTYRMVFEKLIQEELEFLDDKDEFLDVPTFGNSKTEFEKVSEFYAYWSNYSTKKSYVWLDPFNIKEIKERRYFKLVEKENKKVRQKAKKERNEEIRNLVAFIRKRDKRVQAQKKVQEQKLLEDKKKRDEWSKQKRLERRQLNESGTQAEWTKFDNVKSELEEIEKNLAEQFGEVSDSEEDEELNNLYCVACNKVFKTPRAFENHESSKKHRENIELLKSQMLEEDEEDNLDLDSDISDDVEDYADFNDETSKDIDQQIQDSVHKDAASDSEDIDIEDVEEIEIKSKKKKQRNVLVANDHEHQSETGLYSTNSEDDFDFGKKKKPKKKNKKNASQPKQEQKVNDELSNVDFQEDEENVTSKNTKKNKKDKKNKKVVLQSRSGDLTDIDINNSCVTCKSNFPSKNKLFDHLKKTGHGVYIPANVKNKNRNIKEK